jgi:GAF domain-containing protein
MTRNEDFFKTFCRVSRSLGSSQDISDILDVIVSSAVQMMEAHAACLWLMDEERQVFTPRAQQGLSSKYFETQLETEKIKQVLEQDGYLMATEATSDPRLAGHEAKKAEGIASMLIVPVSICENVIGVLSIYSLTSREFSNTEIQFLTAMAEQGAMAIDRARLLSRLRRNVDLFYDLASSLNSSLEVSKIMHILSAELAEAFGMKAASVRLLDEDQKRLELVASYGLSESYLSKGPISSEKSITKALKGEAVVVENAAEDPGVQYREEKKEEGIASILCVPIKAREDVIGVLRLYTEKPRTFNEELIKLVSALAHQGGLAIVNASLYLRLQEDMQDLRDEIWTHRAYF